jgi:L-2,4-diaminobutyric acid acetyltransferase
MILNILKREKLQNIKYLETTITQENLQSKTLFTSIADDLDAKFNETLFFSRDDFGELDHADEFLIKIGPFKSRKSSLPVKLGENALIKN